MKTQGLELTSTRHFIRRITYHFEGESGCHERIDVNKREYFLTVHVYIPVVHAVFYKFGTVHAFDMA
jgi:hypothetical protein